MKMKALTICLRGWINACTRRRWREWRLCISVETVDRQRLPIEIPAEQEKVTLTQRELEAAKEEVPSARKIAELEK